MNNSTSDFEALFPHNECITWIAVMMVESVAIVTLNVVTIIFFIKIRSLRRRSMYLVINLAVADMFVGGISEVYFFYYMGVKCNFWKYDVVGIWRVVFEHMQTVFLVASIIDIVAISLERMHATFFPLRHRVIKKRIYMVTIAILWVLAAVVSASFTAIIYQYPLTHYFMYSSACFVLISLLTICVSYASIVVKIYCGAHPQHHSAESRERKLTVTLFIMTLVSLLTWLPFVLWRLLIHHHIDEYTDYFRITIALVVLCDANSLVNPILYAIRMPEFKRALVSLFLCRPQQRQVVLPLRVM